MRPLHLVAGLVLASGLACGWGSSTDDTPPAGVPDKTVPAAPGQADKSDQDDAAQAMRQACKLLTLVDGKSGGDPDKRKAILKKMLSKGESDPAVQRALKEILDEERRLKAIARAIPNKTELGPCDVYWKQGLTRRAGSAQ